MNSVYITLGSNIQPVENLAQAAGALRDSFGIVRFSSIIETVSDGTIGPNFLNAAATFSTTTSQEELKFEYLRPLETKLGRIRTEDKNSPRPIDLDIAIFNSAVIDPKIWARVYLAIPLCELFPDLREPQSGQTLSQITRELKERTFWKARPDIVL